MNENGVLKPWEHPHPGQVIRAAYLERFTISLSDAAAALGISRTHFSQLINGHYSVSPEVAIRLSLVFGTPPEMWLMLQMNWDLQQARAELGDLQLKRLGE